jgi:hypothetical protein
VITRSEDWSILQQLSAQPLELDPYILGDLDSVNVEPLGDLFEADQPMISAALDTTSIDWSNYIVETPTIHNGSRRLDNSTSHESAQPYRTTAATNLADISDIEASTLLTVVSGGAPLHWETGDFSSDETLSRQ